MTRYKTQLSEEAQKKLSAAGAAEYKRAKGAHTWPFNAAREAFKDAMPQIAKGLGVLPALVEQKLRETIISNVFFWGAEDYISKNTYIDGIAPIRRSKPPKPGEFEFGDTVPNILHRRELQRTRTYYNAPVGPDPCGQTGEMRYEELPLYVDYLSTKLATIAKGRDSNKTVWDAIEPFWREHQQLDLFHVLERLGLVIDDEDAKEA